MAEETSYVYTVRKKVKTMGLTFKAFIWIYLIAFFFYGLIPIPEADTWLFGIQCGLCLMAFLYRIEDVYYNEGQRSSGLPIFVLGVITILTGLAYLKIDVGVSWL